MPLHHTLRGKISRLRPVLPEDLEFVYTISSCEENGFRWRYRGVFPDIGSYGRDHDKGTLLQLLVVTVPGQQRAGIVNLYSDNLRDQWAYVGALAAPEFNGTGVVVDGAATMIDYAFNLWPLRKIYLETIEYNLTEFEAGLRRVAVEEGRLREHVFFGDRYWDVVTSAPYRDRWRQFRASRTAAGLDDSAVTSAVPLEPFLRHLADELDLPDIRASSRLCDDLGMDSLLLAEMVTVVCDLAYAAEPDGLPDLATVADVYRWYTALCSASGPG